MMSLKWNSKIGEKYVWVCMAGSCNFLTMRDIAIQGGLYDKKNSTQKTLFLWNNLFFIEPIYSGDRLN